MDYTDTKAISRFPLEWPITTPRTRPSHRVRGAFRAHGVPMSVYAANQRLGMQIERMGGERPTLSTNVELRLDGTPRSNSDPSDPGVALYFYFKGRATVFACDAFTRVADNIAAIAAHIDALRRVERYKVGTIEQALQGYRALPADTAANWRNVFGFGLDEDVREAAIQERYRARAKLAHPDVTGTEDQMSHLNRAREFALRDVRR